MDGEKKKRSFSYDIIGDQKLKLIDISTEDDFLIDSPLFHSLEDLRLSVTLDNINENGEDSNFSRTAVNQQKEPKHLSSARIQPGRPSFLRKSSAWDNAFFTSAGLLDPHELSSMNKEFDTLDEHPLPFILENVRARRPVLPSISNIRTGSRDMIDHRLVSKKRNINDARAERSKTQQPCKRREFSSVKLPKVPRASKIASTWQSKISSPPRMYPVDRGGKKRTTSSPLYETSAYARKRGETGKVKLSASDSSTKTPIRSSTNVWSFESSYLASSTNRARNDSSHRLNMTFGPTWNLWSPSRVTRAVASVPRENSQPSGLCMPSPKFGFFDEDMSVVRTSEGNSIQRQKKQGISASIDKRKSAEASSNVKRARSPLCTDIGSMKTRGIPGPRIKPRYAASDTQKDGFDMQSNKYQTDKSIEIDRKVCSKLRKVGAGEHDRKKVGVVKTKLEREKLVKKDDKGIDTMRTTITPQSQASRVRLYESSQSMSLHLSSSQKKGIRQENEVAGLSRYLELIDLNDGTETLLKQGKSFPRTRTPLVETKSVCNRSVFPRSDMIKDKEISLLSSKGTDKENN